LHPPALDPALVASGLRRALLAGAAREAGLRANPAEIRSALAEIHGSGAIDERLRLAEDLALERLVFGHASRMLNDGPSPEEAAAAERLLRGKRRP
jgi:hypothetical protein